MSKAKHPANMVLLTASEHFFLHFAISAPLIYTCFILKGARLVKSAAWNEVLTDSF